MEKQKYTALTIGPIFDTMEFATKPGALWVASYMFSYLTRCLCQEIVSRGIPKENIITPFYDPDDDLLNKADGVGLFHDRIIFVHDESIRIDIKGVKAAALKKVFTDFGFDEDESAKNFLTEYILIADATFDATDKEGKPVNPIFKAGDILDSLELRKTFTHRSQSNPLLHVFVNPAGHGNEEVKKLPAVGNLDNWQLRKKGNDKQLRSLADIATCDKYNLESKTAPKPKKKKYYYYAVVRSDGDNMSRVIAELGNDAEKIRTFSANCLRYCSEIAKTVYNEFKGVTIYSGGDDLLAVLPCETADGKGIFEYIRRANEIFRQYFDDEGTSLSFGISVCYYKFPLYEALSESADLLINVAKSEKYGKNCAAINFHKHSGQTSGLVIRNGDALDEILQLCALTAEKKATDNKCEDKQDILLSILYKLPLYEHLFRAAGSDAQAIGNIFKNCFDAPAHATAFVQKTIPAFYQKIDDGSIYIRSLDTGGRLFENEDDDELTAYRDPEVKKITHPSVITLGAVLRVIKFFHESAGEKT